MARTDTGADGAELSVLDHICSAHPELVARIRSRIGEDQWAMVCRQWTMAARRQQLPPTGDWRVWLIMAGRGFGKTRAGAEWVDAFARSHPGARIALVGATADDVRSVMIEGDAGILACAPTAESHLSTSARQIAL